MGDPRKIRSKIEGPGHPWIKERIEQEKILVKEYGLKNKCEIWKHISRLKGYAKQAKRLVALRRLPQAEKEKIQLLAKLNKLGILSQGAVLEDVLGLTIKDILELRLQTQVCRKGLAKTMKQARQFITHGHILVNGKKVTAPSYIVSSAEAPTIGFIAASALSDAEHPERKIEKAKVTAPKPAEKSKEGAFKGRFKRKPGAKGREKPKSKPENKESTAKPAEKKEQK